MLTAAARALGVVALLAGCRATPQPPPPDRRGPAAGATRLVADTASSAAILSMRRVDAYLVRGDTVVQVSVPCYPPPP